MRIKRMTRVASLLTSLIACRFVSAGEYFDPGLLDSVNGSSTVSDTSLLSQGIQPAGMYRVKIKVNDELKLIKTVKFELNKEKQLKPCLSFTDYKKLGVDMSKVSSSMEDNESKNACESVEDQVPGVKVDFDFSQLTLKVTIPQTVLLDENTDGVPIEEWDEGIPGIISNYQASGQQYLTHRSTNSSSSFVNFTNGINLGAWRYRNNSTLSSEDGWKNLSSFIERAIPVLKSELTIGDANTPGDIFDSLSLRGVQLTSDTDMLPDQMTGFAPIVRGIAKSNAQVTIRENGNVIYQMSVPPGPFAISDLSSVSDGGKLDVTVREADGSETHTTVAYSSVPQLLRMGQVKYSLAAGKYSALTSGIDRDKNISQAVLSYGLPGNLTLYGGSQYHQDYRSYVAGLGIDLQRLGGIALDLTRARRRRDDGKEVEGQMTRLTYRNYLEESDTQIQLDARSYKHDYLSLSDWMNNSGEDMDSRKSKEYNLTINQSLFGENSFFTTLNRTDDMDHSVSRMWQIGWNGSIKAVSFSLSYSMTRNQDQPEWDKQLALTLSVPFSAFSPEASPMVNYSATSGLKGDLSNQLGISGQLGERQNLNWNTQMSYASQHGESDTQSASAGIDYQGNYGAAGVSFNADRDNVVNWNASGSLVAHRHGITAGRYANGSMALIAIPGAAGVPLEGGDGQVTDRWGYAIMPDVRPYRRNSFSIDTRNMSKKLDFDSTTAQAVPTKDALVLGEFTPISGRKMVATLNYNGSVPPFGARAKIKDKDDIFYVGDLGQVYINATPEQGTLEVSWGDNHQCTAPFNLPPESGNALPITLVTLECH